MTNDDGFNIHMCDQCDQVKPATHAPDCPKLHQADPARVQSSEVRQGIGSAAESLSSSSLSRLAPVPQGWQPLLRELTEDIYDLLSGEIGPNSSRRILEKMRGKLQDALISADPPSVSSLLPSQLEEEKDVLTRSERLENASAPQHAAENEKD